MTTNRLERAAREALMKPCWRDHGLTEQGAQIADDALLDMLALVQRVGPDIANIVLREVVFRVRELPRREPTYRQRYLKANR